MSDEAQKPRPSGRGAVTYTDIPTFTPANPDGSIEVLVSDHAVVTWEKLDAQ